MMGALARSAATLRIGGDDLNPVEMTQLLGTAPTLARVKGELMKPVGKAIARTGLWHLRAGDTKPANIDEQVAEILAKLPSDLGVWRSLIARYRVNLFCGWFMDQSDEGLELSPRTLSTLGDRGIELQVCLYAPTRD
jgi:hypothetical protein